MTAFTQLRLMCHCAQAKRLLAKKKAAAAKKQANSAAAMAAAREAKERAKKKGRSKDTSHFNQVRAAWEAHHVIWPEQGIF